MKISIIVPIYNTEKYLPECIDSILAQTLQDFELILVNDGSPDNSEDICRSYATKDKRIIYIYQKNKGVSVARNEGIKHAHGEYIFFMDSDDTIDKNFLKNSYNTAHANSSDIVVLGKAFLNRMPHPTALPICAMLLKRNFLLQYPDIIFPEGIQPCEDGLFSHMLLAKTNKISIEKEAIYHYRHHEQQNHIQINKECAKVLRQIPIWFNILNDFYTRHNLYEAKALHLARFIEHEPFGFRLCAMPFTKKEKRLLISMIRKFMQQNVLSYISKKEYKSLHWSFRYILKSYNLNLLKFLISTQKTYNKIENFLIKQIINLLPNKALRRKLRERCLK